MFFIASIKMAQRRGRDAWIWGFFGLVFGLIAVLVLWALGDTKEQQRAKLAAREAEQLDPTRAPCPECSEDIKLQARVCHFCGAQLDRTVEPGLAKKGRGE